MKYILLIVIISITIGCKFEVPSQGSVNTADTTRHDVIDSGKTKSGKWVRLYSNNKWEYGEDPVTKKPKKSKKNNKPKNDETQANQGINSLYSPSPTTTDNLPIKPQDQTPPPPPRKSTSTRSYKSKSYESGYSGYCGARTKKGGSCRRRVSGGGFCWQHR